MNMQAEKDEGKGWWLSHWLPKSAHKLVFLASFMKC